jgi:hypothetical protein
MVLTDNPEAAGPCSLRMAVFRVFLIHEVAVNLVSACVHGATPDG